MVGKVLMKNYMPKISKKIKLKQLRGYSDVEFRKTLRGLYFTENSNSLYRK